MKNWIYKIVLLVLVGFGGANCSNEDDVAIYEQDNEPQIIEGVYNEWNLVINGESIRLSCGIDSIAIEPKYCWYEIIEGDTNIINGAVNNFYDTSKFDNRGIKNYVCRMTYRNNLDTMVTIDYPFHVSFTGLPLVVITTEGMRPVDSKTEKIPGILRLLTPEGSDYEELNNIDLLINGRGNSSWNLAFTSKRSFNIKFDKKIELCGMAKSKKWALIDNHHDRSLLRNLYVSYINHHVFTNVGWNPKYIHCDFILNGEYRGNYIISERNKIETERINVKDISKVDDVSEGGFLCEIDERFDEVFHFRTTHGLNTYSGKPGVAICLKDPDEVSDEVFNYVKAIVQTAEDALFSEDFNDPNIGYAKYFDVDALVDWYLIHEFVCMFDASDFYTSAFFFYNPTDQKLHMGPCWDYDTAMRRDVMNLEVREINSWYKRLFEDGNFEKLVKKRWNEKKYQLKESISKLDEFFNGIHVSADYNFMRWPILGTYYEGQDTWVDLKSYQDQVNFLKDWVFRRYEFMCTCYY